MVLQKLNKLVKLNSKVCIYVPSTFDINNPIDNSQKVNDTLKFLAQNFGGSTSTKAIGSWISEKKGLVTERVVLCFSYTDTKTLDEKIEAVLQYCYKLKKDMLQESISLEVNNELYFI